MSRRESLSLEEFATAPRKQTAAPAPEVVQDHTDLGGDQPISDIASPSHPLRADAAMRQEARRALRRVKRERVKGEVCFVNVSLDQETKRRLKLASFNADSSMQAIMERAIVKYLDDNGL